MKRVSLAVGLVAGACGLLLAAHAQTSPVQGTNPAVYNPTSLEPDNAFALPRTPDGRPDFQGVVWDANFFAYLQSASALTVPEDKQKATFDRIISMFLNNPEYKIHPEGFDYILKLDGMPLVRGERRSRLLVQPADGRLPLMPEARQQLAKFDMSMAPKSNDPEDRGMMERCLSVSELPPFGNMFIPNTRSFVQTREHLVMHLENGDEARIIPFATKHAKTALTPSYGDAIAYWDGDTLVIETTNLPGWQRRRFLPAYIINADAKVIERYTRVSENELLYQFTIEDPKVYSAPWLAEYSLFRAPFRMFPSGCHEANYSLPNILRGQRVADERAAIKAK
jgi:hypothetical protein